MLGLILILALQVTARGGGRSSGGSRSSSYRSYSRHSYHGGGGGGYGGLPVWAIILIIGIIIFALVCICCGVGETSDQVGIKNVERQGSMFSRTLSYEGTIPCYLCLNKVRNSDWDSGEHRRRCAFNNQRELLGFPQPYDAYCPNCSERLRLWPAKGHPFYCDECPYDQRNVLKRSTGENRLNCFLCDFDCCVNCSGAERFQRVRPEARLLNEEPDRVSDGDIERAAANMAAARLIETSYREGENENQPTLPYNPTPFSTTPATYNPVNYSHRTQEPENFNTPFIIPQKDDPPAYPAEQYNSSSQLHPAAPSNHPSLPYAISPYSQTNPPETEFSPTAPPLIKPY